MSDLSAAIREQMAEAEAGARAYAASVASAEDRIMFGMRMRPELKRHLRTIAASRDLSASELINIAITLYIGRGEGDEEPTIWQLAGKKKKITKTLDRRRGKRSARSAPHAAAA